MKFSRESLSTLSNTEVVLLQDENRQWNKNLRQRMADLVDSRMAQQISYEEYTATRKATKDEAAECEEQLTVLRMEMARRDR
ncbi:MAG TPA: hypothetical protein VFB63_30280 [Bryobacteraceae bacterium]|jgi:hypothetical protein|nr:hypothetical protein [Bryobacteraceae bacterium]